MAHRATLAGIVGVEAIVSKVKAVDAGTTTPAQAAAEIASNIASAATADADADKAGMDAIDARFPPDEVTPKP